jgi:hypothetical protein
LFKNVEARDRCASRGWRHKARQNPHSCAFAGTVWPEKSHDLSFANFEIQIMNRRLARVTFSEIFDFDHETVMLSDN